MARRLRRQQTPEEKELWRALRAGRFAGFKFRRQHPIGPYFVDFYCAAAKLAVELDGFRHGLPEQQEHDRERAQFLEDNSIQQLRFWNRRWHENRDGILLEIWRAVHRRTGCMQIGRKEQNLRYVPPGPSALGGRSPLPHSLPPLEQRGEG